MRVKTKYDIIKQEFKDKIKTEEKKYPFSDREKIFIEVIFDLINTLQLIDYDRHY